MFSEFFEEQTLLFVALAVILLMLGYSYFGNRLLGYKSVNIDEATRLFNDDAFLLDVRSASEYREGHIGHALNISVGNLVANLNKLPENKECAVLIYCLSGTGSSKVAGILAKNGYTNIFHLAGGIGAWKSAGLPIGKGKFKK